MSERVINSENEPLYVSNVTGGLAGASTEAKQDDMIDAVEIPTSGGAGQLTLTTSSQALPSTACRSVIISAPSTNAKVAYVNIGAAATTSSHILGIGKDISIPIDNLDKLNFLGVTAGDIISYIYVV